MRVNIYAEEMPRTPRIEIVEKTVHGQKYTGLRIYLELPATVNGQHYQGPFLRQGVGDNSAAVTFWGKRDLRRTLRDALILLDEHYNQPEPPKPDYPVLAPAAKPVTRRRSGRPKKGEK